jgi:hypothetical protein
LPIIFLKDSEVTALNPPTGEAGLCALQEAHGQLPLDGASEVIAVPGCPLGFFYSEFSPPNFLERNCSFCYRTLVRQNQIESENHFARSGGAANSLKKPTKKESFGIGLPLIAAFALAESPREVVAQAGATNLDPAATLPQPCPPLSGRQIPIWRSHFPCARS